jgi:hypothetical protein
LISALPGFVALFGCVKRLKIFICENIEISVGFDVNKVLESFENFLIPKLFSIIAKSVLVFDFFENSL